MIEYGLAKMQSRDVPGLAWAELDVLWGTDLLRGPAQGLSSSRCFPYNQRANSSSRSNSKRYCIRLSTIRPFRDYSDS